MGLAYKNRKNKIRVRGAGVVSACGAAPGPAARQFGPVFVIGQPQAHTSRRPRRRKLPDAVRRRRDTVKVRTNGAAGAGQPAG